MTLPCVVPTHDEPWSSSSNVDSGMIKEEGSGPLNIPSSEESPLCESADKYDVGNFNTN